MSIVKAFIGGLIGAVVAVVALTYLRDGSMRGYEWFPVVTGLLTGLGARLLTGSVARSVATGAISAIVSLIAILAGDELVEMWKLRDMDLGPVAGLESRATARPKATDSDASEEGSADEGSADGQADASEEGDTGLDGSTTADATQLTESQEQRDEAMARARAPQTSVGATEGVAPAVQRPKTWRDFAPYVFSGLGVLIAYQLGRGSGGGKVRSHHSNHSPTDHEEAT